MKAKLLTILFLGVMALMHAQGSQVGKVPTKIFAVFKITDPKVIKIMKTDTLVSEDPYNDDFLFNMEQYSKDSVCEIMCGFKQPGVKGFAPWAESLDDNGLRKTRCRFEVIIFKFQGNRRIKEKVYYMNARLLRYRLA